MPPARYTLFYDGRCPFCERGSRALLRLASPGAVERVDSYRPGAFDGIPGMTLERAMGAMQLLDRSTGFVCEGAEAAVRALATRPVWGWLMWVWAIPPARWLMNAVYGLIARNRYRLGGRIGGRNAESCETGACPLPGGAHDRPTA